MTGGTGGPGGPGPGAFSPDELALIRGAGRPGSWRRGDVLLREGDVPDVVLLIARGLVKITTDSGGGYTSLLAVRGPGELVGELSCLDGRVRLATATAMGRVQGVVVPARAFKRLLAEHGSLALAVLRNVAVRLRDSDGLRAEHGASPAGARVGRVLLGLALRHGTDVTVRPDPGGTGAVRARAVYVSQQELAGAAGTSRESVVRTLRALQAEDLVRTARGRVLVTDPHGLDLWVRQHAERHPR